MNGSKDLEMLLCDLAPELIDGRFVFATFTNASYGDYSQLQPLGSFIEDEGLTLIVTKEKADQAQIAYQSIFRCITLKVHSSLDAVGLTAAFASKLTEHGISANVVAAYYHDHIFVQEQSADQALAALSELSTNR